MQNKKTINSVINKYCILLLLQFFLINIYSQTINQTELLSKRISNGDKSALTELEKISEYDKAAARTLGVHYFKGIGVQPNKSKAIEYFVKASKLGDSKSTNLLEKMGYYNQIKNSYIDISQWPNISIPTKPLQGHGSSFAINNQGIFVTNQHVIEKCEKIIVNYQNRQAIGNIVGISKNDDLAIIETGKNTPSYLTLSQKPAVQGDEISVGGYPIFGYFTYSDGIISAIPISGAIQLSAQISSGNSGGPLTNTSGALLGVIVGTIPSGKYDNIAVGSNFNFAIEVSKLIELLAKNYIKFEKSHNSKELERKQLVKLLELSTARIDCF